VTGNKDFSCKQLQFTKPYFTVTCYGIHAVNELTEISLIDLSIFDKEEKPVSYKQYRISTRSISKSQ